MAVNILAEKKKQTKNAGRKNKFISRVLPLLKTDAQIIQTDSRLYPHPISVTELNVF